MRFRFKTKKLSTLYTEEKGAHKYPREIVESFFDVMAAIHGAKDERDLYALKSLRFEKLLGNRKGQRSLRLNDQWRLIVTIEEDDEGAFVQVVSIERHYE